MNKFNILIVEDNKIVVMGIRKIYSKHIPDANVVSAENGLEALDLLSKIDNNLDLPSFILLDINMPILNGIEFLEIINKDEKLNEIPVVIHTTSSNIEDYNTCKSLGISSYYVKNIDFTTYKNNIITIADYWKNSFKNTL
jgi:CheY-like chemotaxis protein